MFDKKINLFTTTLISKNTDKKKARMKTFLWSVILKV